MAFQDANRSANRFFPKPQADTGFFLPPRWPRLAFQGPAIEVSADGLEIFRKFGSRAAWFGGR